MSDAMAFNGIDGSNGAYLLDNLSRRQISDIALAEKLDPGELQGLKHRLDTRGRAHLGVREGIDPTSLAEAGWGIIFPFGEDDATDEIMQALAPLLELRHKQAGDLYYEFTGDRACRQNEPSRKFLARHGVGVGQPADPQKMPYYLLIVADPETIPFQFQYQLDVTYAVGRIHFESLQDYAHYAESVVAAESGASGRRRAATFFAVQNPADRATKLSAGELVVPLAETLGKRAQDWELDIHVKDDADKKRLSSIFSDADGPALLFTASHGMGFPSDHPLQLRHQGALLCQDWPGPLKWMGKPIPEEFYFSGDDLDDARLGGLVAFHFACYGAGTPELDYFAREPGGKREALAPRPFIARLPQNMLCHPGGAALAVIGHVDRAWGYSFMWPGAGAQRAVFEDSLLRLLSGHPVGSAMEYFNDRHAALSVMLSDEIEEVQFTGKVDEQEIAGSWTARNDARSYLVLGDPAVRLNVM